MRAQVLLLVTSAVFSQAAAIVAGSGQVKRSADVVGYDCGYSSGKRSTGMEDRRNEFNERSGLGRGGGIERRTFSGGEPGDPVGTRGYVDHENPIGARAFRGVFDSSRGYKRSDVDDLSEGSEDI